MGGVRNFVADERAAPAAALRIHEVHESDAKSQARQDRTTVALHDRASSTADQNAHVARNRSAMAQRPKDARASRLHQCHDDAAWLGTKNLIEPGGTPKLNWRAGSAGRGAPGDLDVDQRS